jgi:tetratricopeptide (TPR) repeat protein
MDSKKRHEMATNELSDWIGQIPDFLKQYRNQLLGLILVAVGLISWPILNRWRQETDFSAETELSQTLDSLEMGKFLAIRPPSQNNPQDMGAESFLITANNLAEQAKKAPTKDLAALALIKRGQALRTDLLYRKEIITEDAAASQIKQAQEAYQQAFDKAALPTVKAMAQFGLGICSEELGQLEQAREIYQKIADDASYAGTPLPAAAKGRIEKMADNNAKYTFIEKPKATSIMELPATPAAATGLPQAGPRVVKDKPVQTAPPKTESPKQEQK